MKYQKYDMGRYRLHFLKTNRYKTITIKVNFKEELQKEDVTKREMLLDMLLMSTKDYPTRRNFQLKKEELYNLLVNGNSILSGRYSIMSLSIRFLNENLTEKGMLKQSLQFLFDMLFKPNVENDSFNEKLFQQQRKNYQEYIKAFDEVPENYTIKRFDEIRGKGTPRAFHSVGYLEDLEKITPHSLYEYYKKVLKENIIDIFIIGDFLEEEIKSYFEENFLLKGNNPTSKEHAIIDNHIKEVEEVIEEADFEQSKLAINLKCEELSEYESKYVLGAYSYILGGSPESMLFQEVRENNSLCYFISANSSLVYQTVTIMAGIDQKDYEKTLTEIKKILKNMEDGKFDDDVIEQYKTTYLSSLDSINETPESVMNIYENHEYVGSDLREAKRENVQKLTKEQIIQLAKKVHLDTIYFLKGVLENDKA